MFEYSILFCLSLAICVDSYGGLLRGVPALVAGGGATPKPVGLVVNSLAGPGVRKTPPLVPRAGASGFKVLQLADLHLGEDFGGTWGPEQDRKTLEAVEKVLISEKPDLVVFSGDQ